MVFASYAAAAVIRRQEGGSMLIARICQLIRSFGALRLGVLAETLNHQIGSAQDVDLRDHALTKAIGSIRLGSCS